MEDRIKFTEGFIEQLAGTLVPVSNGLSLILPGHVFHLQILNGCHCVVVIDCRGEFVKIVPADTGDAGMQTLNFAFLLLPAGTERDPAASLTPEPEPLLLVWKLFTGSKTVASST